MKRAFVIGLIAALLILVMVPALAQDKADKKETTKACCAGHGCEGMMICKDAKLEVVNTENGVTITITADKAEDVKAIQECAAKCSAHAEKCAKGDKKACCAKKCTAEEKAKCKHEEKKAAGCEHGKEKKDA